MTSIPDGLFEKMVQEFDARGCYAVEMLKTADWLLGPTAHAPRRSSAAAYCIRQAVIELFQSKADPKYTRYAVSKEIVGAKRRFRNSNHPADTELQKLLDAVGKLEEILNANTEHQNRLAATIKRRTGRDPWSGENSPMKVYRQEISRLNTLAHDVAPKVESTDAVRECLERILDMLAWILLPTKRQAEIINLAEMPEPHGPDARHLREVMVSANDFDLFASKVQSPAWFQIIDRSMLKPPLDNSPWLAGYLVRHLKPAHLDAFVSLIQKNWGDWTRCDVSHGEFAWLLHRLGDRGTPFLINLLRRDPTSKTACFYASRACSDMQASNPSVAILADLLLTPDSGLGYYDRAVRVPAKLVEGMTDLPSSEERIEILTFKLRNQLRRRGSFRMKGYASVANLDYDASYPANSLLAHLRDALKKGKELGNSTSRMVAWLAPLPDDVRSRLVAWLYSIADDADCLDMADFVASGISGRLPTGDDVALLDRLGRDCNTDAVATRLAGIIGEAPKLDNLKNIMRGGHGTEDARRITWAVAMKNDIKHTEWKETLDALAELGIGGDSVRERPVHVSIGPTSPFGAEQFADADPYDLAAKITSWRPGTKNGPNPPSALGIRRILKDSAKRDPGKWAKDPVRMINLLRHPTYVAGYFLGMSHADGSLDSYADRLVRAVCFAHTHPWQVVPLDPSPFEYDADWQNADMAGIDLIRTLVERNAPIGDESMSDAWKLVRESASGESAEPDTHAGDLSVQSSSEDGVLDVVSPRMSALDTMLRLIQYAKDCNRDVPGHVLEMLTESLLLSGRDGAERRSILASNVRILRFSLPNWFEQNEPFLFGREAPENLAQLSLDAHLKYDYLDESILERYKDGVLDAVRRDVDGAMDCLVLGMFRVLDGYDPNSLTEHLTKMGAKYVSLAGECSARLLADTADMDYMLRGTDLWRCTLDSPQCPEALAGYGMWAYVSALEQCQWEDLTLRTCKQAEGQLDRAEEIANRVCSAGAITDRSLKILRWIIHSKLAFFDEDFVAKRALDALRRSKDELGTTESWILLSETLLDRGHYHKL